MLRKSFSLIVIAMLVGCTNTPISPTHTNEAPIIVESTTVEQLATDSPSSESPVSENTLSPERYTIHEYPVPAGTHPHDVAPAPDGTVWYTAQHVGALGRLGAVPRVCQARVWENQFDDGRRRMLRVQHPRVSVRRCRAY